MRHASFFVNGNGKHGRREMGNEIGQAPAQSSADLFARGAVTSRALFSDLLNDESVSPEEIWRLSGGSYSSYAEFKSEADEALRRERDAAWLEWSPTLRGLGAKHGKATRSRIGVVAKLKNGKHKVRLVHDLRRSSVNAQIRVGEKVVLPRLLNVVNDSLTLLGQYGSEECEYMVLDFKTRSSSLSLTTVNAVS